MSKIIIHADDYGRSRNISKSIFTCIKKKIVNSVSIIVTEKIYGQNYIKKLNVKKRLHVNLTDFSKKKSLENSIYNNSFIDLLFMPFLPSFEEKKKSIEKEIIRQIKTYKKIFNTQKIFVDGHQHVHMIPWIFNIIYKHRKKEKITNIRIPNESFVVRFYDLFRINILKNILKLLLIKLLIFISKNKVKKVKYSYDFSGIIYSGFQTSSSIKKVVSIYKSKKLRKKLEILVHPGFASTKERKLFKKYYFDYYYSKNRKKEFNTVKSIDLKKLF